MPSALKNRNKIRNNAYNNSSKNKENKKILSINRDPKREKSSTSEREKGERHIASTASICIFDGLKDINRGNQ